MTNDGTTGQEDSADGGNRRLRRPWAVELGSEMRDLRSELRRLRDQGAATDARVSSAVGHVAKILPRLDVLENRWGTLAAHFTSTDAAGPEGPEDSGEAGQVGVTPVMRWSALSAAEAAVAWEALGRWVTDVLCDQYRLTRLELPDCWPVHPRAVRELAWLRTSYHAGARPEAGPFGPAEWHTRWLPGALKNLSVAIDPRECAPGRHRLTEDERHDHEQALERASNDSRPAPALTGETGAGRPRYLPDLFPPLRSAKGRHPSPYASGGPATLDAETPAPPSTPNCWAVYYDDALDEDLARRRRVARSQHGERGQDGERDQDGGGV